MDGPAKDDIAKVCREILAPLVRADGGEMYLVKVTADDVHIHLTGACAGCPGAALTRDKLFAPILLACAPKIRLTMTTGWRVPEGATRVDG